MKKHSGKLFTLTLLCVLLCLVEVLTGYQNIPEVGLRLYSLAPLVTMVFQLIYFTFLSYVLKGLKNNNDNTYKELSKSLQTTKLREQANREQEQMLQALEEGILLVKDGLITFVNKKFCKMLVELKVSQMRFLDVPCFNLKYDKSSGLDSEVTTLRRIMTNEAAEIRDNVYEL